MTGKFIVLDGIDSTVLLEQRDSLAGWLRNEGVQVQATREPSEGAVGATLRRALGGDLELAELAMPPLFLADRIDHLQREGDGILAQLAAGKWVVCSRYLLSALAYQGRSAPLEWLARINRPCPWPDVMIWCDTPGEAELREAFRKGVALYRDEGRQVIVATGEILREQVKNACRDLLNVDSAEAAP